MKLNWGQSIFLFFVVFISLGIAFIVFSLMQNNDLVSDDYYEKGADYTHQMEINSRSAVYKDSVIVIDQKKRLVARFSRTIDQMADTIHLTFFRPSDKRLDTELQVLLNSDSIMIDKSNYIKGRYLLKFEWKYRHEKYQVVKDYFAE